ncbi:hypothetical protein Nepgr_018181 [Nepenthes gracilis]|uniref:Uncharacterized protein n=1 Tax=Nepenthes gracilis TaxID=150966 RepID=A0AAD3SQT9_NEPGR|nr:hypothetical protein Nepgr_018181 [Nepenthes gracilis]
MNQERAVVKKPKMMRINISNMKWLSEDDDNAATQVKMAAEENGKTYLTQLGGSGSDTMLEHDPQIYKSGKSSFIVCNEL